MRKFIFLLFILMNIQQLLVAKTSYRPNQLIVMFTNTESSLRDEFEKTYSNILSKSIKPVLLSYDANCWIFTTNTPVDSLTAMLMKMKGDKNIKAIQFNYEAEYRSNIPNDSLFSMQWNMRNLGNNGGLLHADVSATDAWDLATGGITTNNDTLIIAIIDGGFQLDHPDLNFWRNHAEIPNDSIDNDSNSYVDDYWGWNTLAGSGNINTAVHGTQVAGIAAAIGNNQLGISGINWNAKIMAVRGTSNPINDSLIIASYGYVLRQRKLYNQTQGAQGAFVVATNSSFGINNAPASLHPIWCEMYDSLGYAGILNATATANQFVDVDQVGDMPTTCTSNFMIAVTNTDYTDQLNQFAAFGKTSVDLSAPGTSIYTTSPMSGYAVSTGTSLSSPHVAGAVAFLLSAASPGFVSYYKNNPSSSAVLLRNCILENVDTLASLNNRCVSKGRLNLYKSAAYIHNLPDSLLSISERETSDNALRITAVFPNPAESFITLFMKANSEHALTLNMFDLLGNTKKIQLQYGRLNQASVQVPVNELATGFYFFQLTDGFNNSNTVKVCIQKK